MLTRVFAAAGRFVVDLCRCLRPLCLTRRACTHSLHAVRFPASKDPMQRDTLSTVVYALLLAILAGYVLSVGRGILLPIVTAVMSVYIMDSASAALSRMPGLSRLPGVLLRAIVLLVFMGCLIVLALVVAATVRDIAEVMPEYRANLEGMVGGLAAQLGVEAQNLWDEIMAVTVNRIELEAIAGAVLGGLTAVGATVFLVVIYASFLFAERRGLRQRSMAAFADAETAQRTMETVAAINRRISDYLAVKTLINILLGTISFSILWVMDVDFALFWAIVIGLLNYIPYVGSYLGVAFPVILSLAQFGSLPQTALLLALLVAAQAYIGNVLEPQWIGRKLNLSPFVVLVALSVWSALWGIPGAILAVPMTSMLVIVLSSFDGTRFLAILLAERVEADTGTAAGETPEPRSR